MKNPGKPRSSVSKTERQLPLIKLDGIKSRYVLADVLGHSTVFLMRRIGLLGIVNQPMYQKIIRLFRGISTLLLREDRCHCPVILDLLQNADAHERPTDEFWARHA